MNHSIDPLLNRRHFIAGATAFGAASLTGLRAADKGDPGKPLTVGVIGHTGHGNYGHGLDTVWLKVPETRIVAVADADDKGRAKALDTLGVPAGSGFADYRKMLTEVKPDLVAVGPRHVHEHRDMAVAAAEAGARGIYIEKPFCRDLAEADAIVAACEKHGTRLAIAHRNRYHPVLPVITKLVEDGAIGRWLEIRARGKEDQRGGGLDLWVLGSHLLNLCHYFAGNPLACSATMMQDGRPVTRDEVVDGAEGVGPLAGNEVHARYEMESGVPVFFDSIQKAGTREAGFGIQLVGTEGIIDLRIDIEPLAHFLPGNINEPSAEPRAWVPITSAGIGKPEPIADIRERVGGHVGAVRDLIAAIREDREPLCSAKDGRVIVEMISAVFESHRLGGARVTLPLEERTHPFTRW